MAQRIDRFPRVVASDTTGECTCIDTDERACGESGAGYFCLDPDAPQDCGLTGSPAPTVSSSGSSGSSSSDTSGTLSSDTSTTYPGCGGYLPHMGDAFCDEDLNNAACGFDGGECAVGTERLGASISLRADVAPLGPVLSIIP